MKQPATWFLTAVMLFLLSFLISDTISVSINESTTDFSVYSSNVIYCFAAFCAILVLFLHLQITPAMEYLTTKWLELRDYFNRWEKNKYNSPTYKGIEKLLK